MKLSSVFTSEIFDYIARTSPGKNNEIQLTAAMYGLRFAGVRYDIGNKLEIQHSVRAQA